MQVILSVRAAQNQMTLEPVLVCGPGTTEGGENFSLSSLKCLHLLFLHSWLGGKSAVLFRTVQIIVDSDKIPLFVSQASFT